MQLPLLTAVLQPRGQQPQQLLRREDAQWQSPEAHALWWRHLLALDFVQPWLVQLQLLHHSSLLQQLRPVQLLLQLKHGEPAHH